MRINKLKVDVLLVENGLTRKGLAELYGCTVNRISCILNSQNVRTATAVNLAKALGCDVTEIIEQTEARS